jgi:1-deoxy-D-xylulose-5-phosphate reductoisomerase
MKIVLLGATGSIGTSVCNCVRRFPEEFKLVGLSANSNMAKLADLTREFRPTALCVSDRKKISASAPLFSSEVKLFQGAKGLEELVDATDFDVLLNALVGAVGLRATVAALKRKKRVALANKESLVIGGDYINSLLKDGFGEIIPVDSEHSAILQCLCGEDRKNIESIILTASGGPFRKVALAKLSSITPSDALNHPTWTMGRKITIDSATLMNKGFEVIEAHHLFHLPYEKIRVLIHPQSIVHSMVEFHDGAIMAQMGVPNMEIPIQFALSYPARLHLGGKRLDLALIKSLTFFKPDLKRFGCLKLCLEAAREGGTMPAVINAANEMAVQFFLEGKIRYDQIEDIIKESMDAHEKVPCDSLETIEQADAMIRTHLSKRYN